jgi:NAD(P)-dependent dehydrogenase (short-subunit alcohol dehydrogenase family)
MAKIELTGRPIAIAGASSGIGAATAVECARAGMPVALGARRADKLRAVVELITGAGGRAIGVEMDVTRPEDCRRLVDACVREFGSIYAVYANAGYGVEAPVAEMSDEQVRAIFETNVFGSLNVIRPALERMLVNPGPHRGHVLWCSSCLGKMSVPYYGAYCATKAAQNHLSRAMNLELRDQGVYSTSVHPLGTRTEFFDQVRARGQGKKLIDYTPDAAMQSPELVAQVTVAALRRPRPEVWTGPKGAATRMGMALSMMMPGMADWSLARLIRARMRAG